MYVVDGEVYFKAIRSSTPSKFSIVLVLFSCIGG